MVTYEAFNILFPVGELITLILFVYYLIKGFTAKESDLVISESKRKVWGAFKTWGFKKMGEEAVSEEIRGRKRRYPGTK